MLNNGHVVFEGTADDLQGSRRGDESVSRRVTAAAAISRRAPRLPCGAVSGCTVEPMRCFDFGARLNCASWMSDMNVAKDDGARPKPGAAPLRFGAFREDAAHVRALQRVKGWTRESLALADHDTVLVAEVACTRPGCPPLETVVTFWSAAGERHWFKVFKPIAEVRLRRPAAGMAQGRSLRRRSARWRLLLISAPHPH